MSDDEEFVRATCRLLGCNLVDQNQVGALTIEAPYGFHFASAEFNQMHRWVDVSPCWHKARRLVSGGLEQCEPRCDYWRSAVGQKPTHYDGIPR
jgi:hypothetical protein